MKEIAKWMRFWTLHLLAIVGFILFSIEINAIQLLSPHVYLPEGIKQLVTQLHWGALAKRLRPNGLAPLFFSFSFANKNLRWLYFLLDIIKRVVYVEVPVFRPHVPNFIPDLVELKDLMKICWEEDPDNRPDFSEIKKRIHKTVVTKGMWVDVVFMLSIGELIAQCHELGTCFPLSSKLNLLALIKILFDQLRCKSCFL